MPLQDVTSISLVQFSHSVVFGSFRPHGLHHASPTVHHQLPELAQTHVHCIGDAIQPSHPLSSPSSPAFNLSQRQGLFKTVSSLHQVAKASELQLQHQSFQWIFRTDFLYNWLVWSPCSPRNSQESSSTPQFKTVNSLALNFLYSPTLTSIYDYWKNHSLDYTDKWIKKDAVRAHNGLFFNHEKERHLLSCNNMDRMWAHYSKISWRRTGILYYTTYIRKLKITNMWKTE